MKWIGWPVAEIRNSTHHEGCIWDPPFWGEGEVVGVLDPYHSKERCWFPIGSTLLPFRYLGPFATILLSNIYFRRLGSVAVGRWTRDQVAGSNPTAAIIWASQPWASCSHLMCLCSPSSITWYLARAITLYKFVIVGLLWNERWQSGG